MINLYLALNPCAKINFEGQGIVVLNCVHSLLRIFIARTFSTLKQIINI